MINANKIMNRNDLIYANSTTFISITGPGGMEDPDPEPPAPLISKPPLRDSRTYRAYQDILKTLKDDKVKVHNNFNHFVNLNLGLARHKASGTLYTRLQLEKLFSQFELYEQAVGRYDNVEGDPDIDEIVRNHIDNLYITNNRRLSRSCRDEELMRRGTDKNIKKDRKCNSAPITIKNSSELPAPMHDDFKTLKENPIKEEVIVIEDASPEQKGKVELKLQELGASFDKPIEYAYRLVDDPIKFFKLSFQRLKGIVTGALKCLTFNFMGLTALSTLGPDRCNSLFSCVVSKVTYRPVILLMQPIFRFVFSNTKIMFCGVLMFMLLWFLSKHIKVIYRHKIDVTALTVVQQREFSARREYDENYARTKLKCNIEYDENVKICLGLPNRGPEICINSETVSMKADGELAANLLDPRNINDTISPVCVAERIARSTNIGNFIDYSRCEHFDDNITEGTTRFAIAVIFGHRCRTMTTNVCHRVFRLADPKIRLVPFAHGVLGAILSYSVRKLNRLFAVGTSTVSVLLKLISNSGTYQMIRTLLLRSLLLGMIILTVGPWPSLTWFTALLHFGVLILGTLTVS